MKCLRKYIFQVKAIENDFDMEGWIKIHRGITSHWIWNDPLKLKWWIDILITVNHTPAKVNIGMQLYECGRGQSIMSLSNWANRWKVSKDKARNFLVLLEKDGMITHESLGKTTRITVCNYDSYQGDLHDSQTISKRPNNDNQTITHTNKNDKNNKNEKNDNKIETEVSNKRETKRFTVPTIQEIKNFIQENSFSVDADTFYDYYQANGWMAGKNHMKDWKATIRNWNRKEWNKPMQKNQKLNFEAGNSSSKGYTDTL